MNGKTSVSAGCHINDVMNSQVERWQNILVSAGCHINDVMNGELRALFVNSVSAGCHINDVMNPIVVFFNRSISFSWMSYQ